MGSHHFTPAARRAFITSVETNTERSGVNANNRQALYERIAKEHLGFETLVARKSDRLDFREVAVWSVRTALEAAFQAGVAHGLDAARKRSKRNTE